MITRVRFRSFKALRDVEMNLHPRLTVLVGPNGSGKTSVLQGIDLVCRTVAQGLKGLPGQAVLPGGVPGFPGPGSNPGLHHSVGIPRLELLAPCVSSGSQLGDLLLECAARSSDGREALAFIQIDKNVQQQLAFDAFVSHSLKGQIKRTQWSAAPVDDRALFSNSIMLRLDPLQLAAPSIVQAKPPLMMPTGAGLPSTLSYLSGNQPDTFAAIENAFKSIIPIVKRIRFDKELAGAGFGDVILFDFVGAANVNASNASNGTLCALGLLTSILSPSRPKLVLLDDLDHGLHPKAQMELVDVLRSILSQYPDLQIVATSHSPFILDKLDQSEVRVMALNDDGSAACAAIHDHPKYPMWKDSMSPGEFWTHVGEDWAKRTTLQAVSP